MRTLVAIVLLVALSLPTLSHAYTIEERAQVVHLADLNLGNPSDVLRLYRRITVASEQVCGDTWDRDLMRRVAAKRCAEDAAARAVSEIGNPALLALFTRKTGRQVVMIGRLVESPSKQPRTP
jgi:UrcA family protein